ncbi:MAG: hypothetical protein ABI857_03110 [Acidobacteriota bacterium]
MELLIPGLILVALMVWASTKIKKRAADAFEAEFIETDTYSLQKPEAFLHVIGDPAHEFRAYSKEFGALDANSGVRQATIEIDAFRDNDLAGVRDLTERSAAVTKIREEGPDACELETEETANEIDVDAVYKLVVGANVVYRLRFAVLREHTEDYLRKIEETLDSFTVRVI